MKYLGVYLDEHLNFEERFRRVETKATNIARCLSRLMPNLHGPGESKKKLYANVIESVVLYAAPVWVDTMSDSRKLKAILRRVQRVYALRVMCAYRTVSGIAACLLARLPPLELLAGLRGRMYRRIRDLRDADNWSPGTEREIRIQERALLLRQWQLYLVAPGLSGKHMRELLGPHFASWIARR